eukprot:TRINITY_DN9622_c0_g1_i1.p1 TRINITY_DN9622_c0_g1~~TRINITY_DN9622_c0_g1_i1.p1  ORF type:complete len:496 (-),score=79.78 TRINITY_DN9622_c0_g1_i1:892-2379(-)
MNFLSVKEQVMESTKKKSVVSMFGPSTLLSVLAFQASTLRDIGTVMSLWRAFLRVLHTFWEECEHTIPLVVEGNPDWDTCLAHQKLQMLNCCILHELSRTTKLHAPASTDGWDLAIEDDEFQDCTTEEASEDPAKQTDPGTEVDVEGRRGASRPLMDEAGQPVHLLRSGKVLYIPRTQEAVPMTEDMVAQQQEALAQLGTSREGHKLRTRLQSSPLLSDMQAFKAANPFDPCLADFVRWHSPKDFFTVALSEPTRTQDERERSCLSLRMQEPGNIWIRMWDEAGEAPACEQPTLFDVVREANAVLHYLDQLPDVDVFQLLLDHLIILAYWSLTQSTAAKELPFVRKKMDEYKVLLNNLLVFTNPGLERYSEVCNELEVLERLCTTAGSLLSRFPAPSEEATLIRYQLVSRLLESQSNGEALVLTPIEWELVGSDLVQDPLTAACRSPDVREFILRCAAERPAMGRGKESACAHRMYAVLAKNEFRLATAFSEILC